MAAVAVVFIGGLMFVGYILVHAASETQKALEQAERANVSKANSSEQDAEQLPAYSFSQADTPPQRQPETPQDVSAVKLFAAYEANEIAADEQYGDRLLRINGRVENIGTDILGTPYVSLSAGDDKFGTVQCMFDSSAGLSALRKGQRVTIVGRCSSKLMNVIVRECQLSN